MQLPVISPTRYVLGQVWFIESPARDYPQHSKTSFSGLKLFECPQ